MPASLRLASAALIGAAGFVTMLAMLGAGLHNGWPLLVAAAIGASLAGGLTAELFGHPGKHGLHRFFIGAILATTLGAALAGLGFGLILGARLGGLFIGPITVFLAVFGAPLKLLVWLGAMGTVQIVMCRLRALHPAAS